MNFGSAKLPYIFEAGTLHSLDDVDGKFPANQNVRRRNPLEANLTSPPTAGVIPQTEGRSGKDPLSK
jgi:hypothetical protein